MTNGPRLQTGRATLLALLLLVPLVHGPGAHATHLAASDPGIAAQAPHADLGAFEEPCTLCVAGRAAIDRVEVTSWQAPLFPSDGLRVRGAGPAHATPDRSRPDAARAPPRALA